jgi:nucleoid DNA-binding protein
MLWEVDVSLIDATTDHAACQLVAAAVLLPDAAADPDAAAVVFGSGCQVIAFGLDATHQVRATEARIRTIEAAGSESARTAASMLRFSQRIEREIVGWEAAPLHDACPIAWLMRPDLFTLKPCRIEVETQSELTRGHTAVEFRVDPAAARHRWAVKADGQGVFDLIAASLKAGDEVRLTGFGVFVVATRAGGKGRNPQTGEEITIKPSKQPRFRAGKQLKDSLN